MATYTRRARVTAPLSEVWAFHSEISGLKALTPEWMNLDVVAVRGPDGDPDPEELVVGSKVRMSARPFGIGPAQRWTSHILEREFEEGAAVFRDEMIGGPFRKWVHTHRFHADGDATFIEDRVEYELPGGPLGRAASPFGSIGFEPMFRYRHRKTKELFE